MPEPPSSTESFGPADSTEPIDSSAERSSTRRADPPPLPAGWKRRTFQLLCLVVALLPLTLLGVASRLEPSPEGLGTHQQLGLPPCTMRVAFGIRCPGCGMTTSWAHFTRGNWGVSWKTNAGGFLLAIASVLIAPCGIYYAKSAKIPSLTAQQVACLVGLLVVVVTFCDWMLRLSGSR